MPKYMEMIKGSPLDRTLDIHPANDVLKLSEFIKLYSQTYRREIQWASRYTILKDNISQLKAKLEVLEGDAKELTEVELQSLYQHLKLNLEMQNLSVMAVAHQNNDEAAGQKQMHQFTNAMNTLSSEYEKLKKSDLKQVSLPASWTEHRYPALRGQLENYENEFSVLAKGLKPAEKDRRIAKYFALCLLKEYPAALAQKGVHDEECWVTIIGRSHGLGLPFQYVKGDLDYLSRMQFIHIAGNDFSTIVDLGSVLGTKAKFKYQQPLSAKQIRAAQDQATNSGEISTCAAKLTSKYSAQLGMVSTVTAQRVYSIRWEIAERFATQSSEEFDISTSVNQGLAIAAIPQNCICCIRMAADHEKSIPVEIIFKNGVISKILAISEEEYHQDLRKTHQDGRVL